jgi:hypothetical protein
MDGMLYPSNMRRVRGQRGLNLSVGVAIVFIFLTALSLIAEDRTVLTIFDRVQFSVPSDWAVISSKRESVKSAFIFQIKNPADEGTPDSTNLAVISYYLREPTAKPENGKKPLGQEQTAKKQDLLEGWDCSSFAKLQASTEYEIWDCHRWVAQCGIHVRLAWPHLHKNPPDYDKNMILALSDVLKSVATSSK